eukprot:CAMPEP_0179240698 /NCGR_PEP_ID=MMETSP0797-20121207/16107_1 /TAXON_ID=47934 /ORGANISM="Dinophysis acuminata, Strain DAEP01" /LENGTH=74 /DNA_ID=CAMNT_0020948053 /DNA_START=75 /DNA_END=299 /DNA_ORIENTATION=+
MEGLCARTECAATRASAHSSSVVTCMRARQFLPPLPDDACPVVVVAPSSAGMTAGAAATCIFTALSISTPPSAC